MTGAATLPSRSGGWISLIERFVFVLLVSLGGTTIVAASWANDFSTPRATLLGANRGVAVLVTAGAARILILDGTNSTELGNAIARARHPGLDRIDLMLVSGNEAASGMAHRTIRLLQPRMVLAIGNDEHLRKSGIDVGKTIDHSTEIELPSNVVLTIEVWPAGEGDVIWSVEIDRGGASLYWVSNRDTLTKPELPASVDVTIIGRGKPSPDTPIPVTRTIVAAGESISGPDLREIAVNANGPETETARVYAGETIRIDLDPSGIRSIEGATTAGSPIAT